jgi:hypothetical protein
MISLQPAPATACDPSQPLVDGDDVFTTGTVVTGLIPNTDYECFVVALFDGEAQCTSADTTDVVPTLPNPPTDVTVSSPAFESLDVAAVAPTDATGGGAVPVAGYAFQCSLASECDPSGTWFPSSAPFASDPATPVTVSGLDPDTQYNCWAATVAGDSAPYEYSCSDSVQGSTAAAAAPTLAAIPGSTPNEVQVTPTASNAGTTLKVACVPATPSLPTCPDATGTGITWTPADDDVALQIGTTVDDTAMVGGTSYTCYAAEFVGTDYRVCSAGSAVVAALNAPSVAAATGLVGGAVSVTGTDSSTPLVTTESGSVGSEVVVRGTAASAGNTGTTLKVSCVATAGASCPAASGATWTDATGVSQQIGTFDDGTATPAPMVGGASYTCYSAEFSGTDYRVCSGGIAVMAALAAPTVATAAGSVSGAVEVTGTAPSSPSNVESTLKIACVPLGGVCPDATGTFTAWAAATGSPQVVSTLADGSSTVGGTSYTCYSAEFSTVDGSYRVCSSGSDVTAKALIAPTVTAVPGTSPLTVEVTATAPSSPSNVDSTLRIACLTNAGSQPECPIAGDAAWVDVTTSGAAQAVDVPTAGALYTCFAAEFSDTPADTYRVCAPGVDVTAALIPPTLTAVVPGTSPGEVDVAATAPSSPSNVDSTLRIACVENAGSPPACPVAGDAAWVDVTTSGAAQAVAGLTAGALYTCFAAEFSDTPADTYRVCAPGADVTAARTPPTLTAVPGTSPLTVEVTATAPSSPSNVDSTLRIACVENAGSLPDCPIAGDTEWVDVTTSGAAQAVDVPTAGALYTCFAAEFANYSRRHVPRVRAGRRCDSGADPSHIDCRGPRDVAG